MNIYCALEVLEQTMHSEATLGLSNRDDNIISTQDRLHNYGASWWKVQLAEKPTDGDQPAQVQNPTTYLLLTHVCY